MSTTNDTNPQELIKSWAEENLISKDEEWPLFEIYENFETRQSKFGIETVIYSVGLSSNLLVSLIDGVAPPANFKYTDLMKSIQTASSSESCFWIRINEPDNCLAIIEEVWEHTWQHDYSQDYQLEELERSPAAEGGCSYLCLVPASKSWILTHELNPNNDFTISIHSNEKFRDDVLSILGVSPVADARAG